MFIEIPCPSGRTGRAALIRNCVDGISYGVTISAHDGAILADVFDNRWKISRMFSGPKLVLRIALEAYCDPTAEISPGRVEEAEQNTVRELGEWLAWLVETVPRAQWEANQIPICGA